MSEGISGGKAASLSNRRRFIHPGDGESAQNLFGARQVVDRPFQSSKCWLIVLQRAIVVSESLHERHGVSLRGSAIGSLGPFTHHLMGRTLQLGVLSIFCKPLLRTPSVNPSENPFPLKTHYKAPPENPCEKLLQSPSQKLRTALSEAFSEACVVARPMRRAPNRGRLESQDTQPPLTPRRGLYYRGRVPDASP